MLLDNGKEGVVSEGGNHKFKYSPKHHYPSHHHIILFFF